MPIPLKTNGTTTIADIIRDDRLPDDIIADLKQKSIDIPSWGDLIKEYDPKKHPVYTDRDYIDKVKAHERVDVHYPRKTQIHHAERAGEASSGNHGGYIQEEPHQRNEYQARTQTICLV